MQPFICGVYEGVEGRQGVAVYSFHVGTVTGGRLDTKPSSSGPSRVRTPSTRLECRRFPGRSGLGGEITDLGGRGQRSDSSRDPLARSRCVNHIV
jgi:hypothetical protein